MEDSYFIFKELKTLYFKQFGCCETSGEYFLGKRGADIYEFIDLESIKDPILSDPAVIEEYTNLISEFLDIEIKRVDNPIQKDISGNPFAGISEKEWNEKFISFKIGTFYSNKQFVAMHTLIRYLWNNSHRYHSIISAALNLRRFSPDLPIQDVFAIAHSFQENTNRALTGKNQYQKFGFMYFKAKEEYLKDLKKNIYFNNAFDSYEINIVPKIKIKGNFFDDSESVFDSKNFISFLTTLDNGSPMISMRMYDNVIDCYKKYKPVYEDLSKMMTSTKLTKYRIMKCDILTDGDELSDIEFSLGCTMTGRTKAGHFKDYEQLKEFLTKLDEK